MQLQSIGIMIIIPMSITTILLKHDKNQKRRANKSMYCFI